MPQWEATKEKYEEKMNKQVYYLSMEFLIGSLLESNLLNCGMLDISNQALEKLGFNTEQVYRQEHDAGLGNGGLGRLAACFLGFVSFTEICWSWFWHQIPLWFI